ncbi:MAG: hypothetical protein ACT4P4_10325 [Betaproteobacteria bacterium]
METLDADRNALFVEAMEHMLALWTQDPPYGLDIDAVVAHAVARDQLEAQVRARHRVRRHARRIHLKSVVRGGLVGGDFAQAPRQPFPLHARNVERLQRLAPERGLAARVEDVAGDAYAEGFHAAISFAVAFCSRAWSGPVAIMR